MNQNPKLWLDCLCHSEVLSIEYDEECRTAYLAIYGTKYSSMTKLTLKQRLVRAAQIIWTGREYNDEIVLQLEDITRLREFLNLINLRDTTPKT